MKKTPYTAEETNDWLKKMKKYAEKEGRAFERPKRGDIWTMDFGLTVGSEIHRVRPAVVISSSEMNEKGTEILVVPLVNSSVSHRLPTFDFHLKVTDAMLAWGAERVEGVIKTESITSLSKGRLGKRIARLNTNGIDQLLELVARTLHCSEFSTSQEDTDKENRQ